MMEISIQFTHSPILPKLIDFKSECGAVVEFQGVVRGAEDERTIHALHYEAYLTMAEKQLKKIMGDLSEVYPCRRVFFIHRLGEVRVNEVSLYVRVDAKHRAEAFGLCQSLIDRMKQDVPIWKSIAD